jgi:hypothetical protein
VGSKRQRRRTVDSPLPPAVTIVHLSPLGFRMQRSMAYTEPTPSVRGQVHNRGGPLDSQSVDGRRPAAEATFEGLHKYTFSTQAMCGESQNSLNHTLQRSYVVVVFG